MRSVGDCILNHIENRQMKKVLKLYYLFFFKLVNLFKAISDDKFEVFKAAVVCNALLIMLALETLIWYIIIFKASFHMNRYIAGSLVAVPIVLLNYFILEYKSRWKKYNTEFENYSLEKHTIINYFVFFVILLIVGSLIFSIYILSTINWELYDS